MKQLALFFIVGIVSSTILSGCKGGDGPEGPAGAALTGNLHGKVYAYDSFGNYLGALSGVQVTAEGTGYTGTSDSLGAYVIPGLPMGTYTLVFSKAGYGTHKILQVQFVGRGDYYLTNNPTLGGLPNFEAATASASISAGNLHVAGTVTGGSPPFQRRVVIYLSKTSGINPSVPATFLTYFTQYTPSSGNSYDLALSVSGLMSDYGFVTGSTFYVAVYSGSYYDFYYYDLATERYVETTFGSVGRPANIMVP